MENLKCTMESYVGAEKVIVSSLKYDALVAKAERLRIVEEIVRCEKDDYGTFKELKKVLGIAVCENTSPTVKGGADDGEIPKPM